MPKRTPLCPICIKKDLKVTLHLKQINLDTAVYLCDEPSCPYPEGYNWFIEKRTLKEMIVEMKKEKKKKKHKLKHKMASNNTTNESSTKYPPVEAPLTVDNLLETEINKLQDSFSLDCGDLDTFLFSESSASKIECDEVKDSKKQIITVLQEVKIDKDGRIEESSCDDNNDNLDNGNVVSNSDDACGVVDLFNLDFAEFVYL